MGSWWGDERLVADLAAATARVESGAAYLDEAIGPEWDRMIDLGRLDIKSNCGCICGQLLRHGYLRPLVMSPRRLVARGFTCNPLAESLLLLLRPSEVFRSYALLTRAWKQAILERRRHRAGPDAMPRPTRPTAEGTEEMELALVGSAR
jgi:hypothetical protein